METPATPQGAKPEGGEDPSMEEILQSIRRIIAEDGDEKKPADASKNDTEEVPGSEVLELTEAIAEEPPAAAPTAAPTAAPSAPVTPPAASETIPADILSKIDQVLAADAAKAPAAAAAPAAPVTEKPVEAPAVVNRPPEPVPMKNEPPANSMLSNQAVSATTASITKLKAADELPPPQTTQSQQFRSGNTVEDLVIQMLKPMIKEWLDANLPAIVENIVEREIRKITRQ